MPPRGGILYFVVLYIAMRGFAESAKRICKCRNFIFRNREIQSFASAYVGNHHNYCFACLDIISSFSRALLCFRASGAIFLRRIFLARSGAKHI